MRPSGPNLRIAGRRGIQERVMSATNSKHVGFWQRFVTWQERSHREIELNNLSDRSLRDIGLTRGDERLPICSPFIRGFF